MRYHREFAAFAALFAVSLLIGWHPLFETFVLSAGNDEYTHILLILPVSAALIYLERQRLQPARGWELRISVIFAGLVVALVSCAHLLLGAPTSDVRLSISMLALVLAWIGIFVLCFGRGNARASAFPLAFLLGLIPLPRGVLNWIIAQLQLESAWAAHAFFAACGVPVVQHGVFLTIPGLTVQVAQECSSIRSSSMLLVTTIVLAQVLLRSPWRRVLVIGLAVPLSVAKNGLRIFTIAMLGTRVDPGYLTGRLHHQGGILFFLIALVSVFAVLAICQRAEGTSLNAS